MRQLGDRSDVRPKVLVISDQLPGYQIGLEHNGAASYLRAFVDRFRERGYDVVWVLLRPRVASVAIRRDALPYRLTGREVTALGSYYVVTSVLGTTASLAYQMYRRQGPTQRRRIAALRAAFRRARGCQSVTGRYLHAADSAYVRGLVAKERPDLILFDSIFCVIPGIAHPPGWIITHDVRHQRHAVMRELGLNPVPYGFSADDERAAIETVGNVIAIQWEEAAEFRRLAPRARVVVVPMALSPSRSYGADQRVEGRCLLVGSASLPNVGGLRWFLESCWESIRGAVPGATLEVCGAVCNRFDDRYDGVRFLGVVDDLGTAYREAAAVVVPLRAGSGLKIKLVEAMAHGAACVTTPVGAQGLGDIDPAPFAVADRADRFARETIRILEDRSWRMLLSERAAAAARRFRPDEAFAEFEAEIAKDAAPQRSVREPVWTAG